MSVLCRRVDERKSSVKKLKQPKNNSIDLQTLHRDEGCDSLQESGRSRMWKEKRNENGQIQLIMMMLGNRRLSFVLNYPKWTQQDKGTRKQNQARKDVFY